LAERSKDKNFDLIVCSDLQRATETVRIAFGDSLPTIADKRLRELNYGDFNVKPSSVVGAMKMEHISKPFPNGEGYEQAIERTHEFYRELKDKHTDATVLVVGHRATQFGLDTLINHKTLEELLSVPFKWQAWWEYEF